MQIDWDHFTPLRALGGGVLIGLSASAMILFPGRIAGVSGILGGLMPPRPGDAAWRVAFVLGLLLAPLAASLWRAPSPPGLSTNILLLATAGALVGFGARLGSGCTSGHGVCGLARLSPRSLAATATFMGAAFVTVFIARHVF
jgi:uncharacterized membrane protein YedE/YeeE